MILRRDNFGSALFRSRNSQSHFFLSRILALPTLEAPGEEIKAATAASPIRPFYQVCRRSCYLRVSTGFFYFGSYFFLHPGLSRGRDADVALLSMQFSCALSGYTSPDGAHPPALLCIRLIFSPDLQAVRFRTHRRKINIQSFFFTAKKITFRRIPTARV